MDVADLVIEVIKSLGIMPAPTESYFSALDLPQTYQVRWEHMVIIKRPHKLSLWLDCQDTRIKIGRATEHWSHFINLTEPDSISKLEECILSYV